MGWRGISPRRRRNMAWRERLKVERNLNLYIVHNIIREGEKERDFGHECRMWSTYYVYNICIWIYDIQTHIPSTARIMCTYHYIYTHTRSRPVIIVCIYNTYIVVIVSAWVVENDRVCCKWYIICIWINIVLHIYYVPR